MQEPLLTSPLFLLYIINMRILILFLLLNVCPSLLQAESIHEWLIPLRDAIYEQKLNVNQVRPLYQAAKKKANDTLSGADLNAALSRCEYFMGRALHFEKQNDSAISHYSEGMNLAKKAISEKPSCEAWLILGENLSQSCSLRSWAFTLANGLDVGRHAEKALGFNKRNAAAQYLIAARWVYAPAAFADVPKGLEMMKKILVDGDPNKDDLFNVYYSIGYAYIQLKKLPEARPWIMQSLKTYPSNKAAQELLDKTKG